MSYFAFEGERELIEQLSLAADQLALPHSSPVPVDSPADALDGPIGPAEIKAALEVVSLALTTGAAAVTFIERLLDLIRKGKQRVTVKNPKDGRTVGQIDGRSSSDEVIKLLDL